MADLRSMLLEGRYVAAENEHGRPAVEAELSEMSGDDLADRALKAADALGYTERAKQAAGVVLCGGYPEWARTLARKYNSDPGL